ncbi:MAG: DUF488 domain-containing protein [Steroidobacteraceae bacterium]|nr:DUF488 domain-containing protein [Steroidobacteraceae bacterium]
MSSSKSRGVRVKRVYDRADPADGVRVLVDRLWPRGIRKEGAALDEWQREVAPSTPLRKWFGHDPNRWQEFRRRYLAELKTHPDALDQLRRLARQKPVTLLYGARDPEHNHAVVLKEAIERKRITDMKPRARAAGVRARRARKSS